MKEIWKVIDNTQEEYAISNLGNVRSYKHKKKKNFITNHLLM